MMGFVHDSNNNNLHQDNDQTFSKEGQQVVCETFSTNKTFGSSEKAHVK